MVRCARQGDDLIPATHLGNPNPPIVQLGWQPMGDHVCIFLVNFCCCCSCFRSVGVTHSAIHQHGIFATGFLIFG